MISNNKEKHQSIIHIHVCILIQNREIYVPQSHVSNNL